MLFPYQELLSIPSTGRLSQRQIFLQHVALCGLLDELRSGNGGYDFDCLHRDDAGRKAKEGARMEDTERLARNNCDPSRGRYEHNRK